MKDENFNNCCGGMVAADGSQDPAPAKKNYVQLAISVALLVAIAYFGVWGAKKIMGK
jgi:hypothetical protein